MIKKALLLIFTANLLAANVNKDCTCNTRELSRTEKIVIGGLVVGGTIAATPYILPASALAYLYAGAIVVGTKAAAIAAPTTVLAKISFGLTVAQVARPLIVQTTEEKLNELRKEKASRPITTKIEFVKCLKANKNGAPRNASGRPEVCEDAALLYAFSAGISELNRRTDAFRNDKCFCS